MCMQRVSEFYENTLLTYLLANLLTYLLTHAVQNIYTLLIKERALRYDIAKT